MVLKMYLHLGQDTVVRFDDIIGIFDIDSASVSTYTKEFLSSAQRSEQVISITSELPKSFVVCKGEDEEQNEKTKVYISQISSTTLLKRANIGGEIFKDNTV